MQSFMSALTSEGKNPALPEAYDYFGKLVGGWSIDYIDTRTAHAIKGEWHFSWVLEGMAIQDVIILPDFEYGTTLRVYDPATHAWDVAYCYTGKIMRMEARRQGDRIVLTNIDDERRKWVFVSIQEDRFHWQDVMVQEDGEWHANYEIYAQRIH